MFSFKSRFGKSISEDEVRRHFVLIVNNRLFKVLDKRFSGEFVDRRFFNDICIHLERDPDDVYWEYNRDGIGSHIVPPLRYLTDDGFEDTLVVVEAIYAFAQSKSRVTEPVNIKYVDDCVEEALDSPLSVGVKWRAGRFYPAGAEELERELVYEVAGWLSDMPKVEELFLNAIDHYSKSAHDPMKRKDVGSNAYQAVDAMSREVLGTKKAFDATSNDLVDHLGLRKEWKQVVHHYKLLSKEFYHPGRTEPGPTAEDAEAHLYLSGLLLRLMLRKHLGKT